MEKEKLLELLLLVYDSGKTAHIVEQLSAKKDGECEKKTEEGEEEGDLIFQCGGLKNFSVLFEKWVKAQTQPFLSCKPLEHREVIEKGKIKGEHLSRSSESNATNTKPKQGPSKKAKKKVAPQTISSFLPASLKDGNISRHTNGFGDGKYKQNASYSDMFPRLSDQLNKTSSAKKYSMEIPNSKTRAVETKVSGDGTLKQAVDSSTEMRHSEPRDLMLQSGRTADHNFTNETPIDKYVSPPSISRQISSNVQSQLDTLGVTVTVDDAHSTGDDHLILGNNLEDNNSHVSVSPLISALPELISNDISSMQASRNLGQIYGNIVLRYHTIFCPLVPCIIYLTKLISVKHVHTGKIIKLSLKDLVKFPSCLLNNKRLEEFVIGAVETMLPLLNSIGGFVMTALADVIESLSPSIALDLQNNSKAHQVNMMISSQQQYEEEKLFSASNAEAFIRPFDDEFDNRHEYKTQKEKHIFNERERCFDDFSNLFRQFQDISRSDLNGSKTSEFWNGLYSQGTRILNLHDCNILWFAKIFLEMLLFHGTNLPRTSMFPRDKKNSASSSSSDSSSFAGSTKQRQLEERLGQTQSDKVFVSRRNANLSAGEGNNRSSSSKFLSSPNISLTSQRIKDLQESRRDPSEHFPGNQQFFFRFLLTMDSSRLNVILQDVMLMEVLNILQIPITSYHRFLRKIESVSVNEDVEDLNIDQSTKDNHSQAFTLRILKLKLLGKFLGFLHFSPFWNTGMSALKDSPLILSAQIYASNRLLLSSSLPLTSILIHCLKMRTLSLAVPWVTSYLKLMSWDDASILNVKNGQLQSTVCRFSSGDKSNPPLNEHINSILIIYLILNTNRISSMDLRDSEVSKNRMSIILEAESFFEDFPALVSYCRAASQELDSPECFGIGIGNELKQFLVHDARRAHDSALDDGNSGLSESFVKYVFPMLYNALASMRLRFEKYKKREEEVCEKLVSMSSVVNKNNPLKSPSRRQAPTLISPRFNVNSSVAGKEVAWGDSMPPERLISDDSISPLSVPPSPPFSPPTTPSASAPRHSSPLKSTSGPLGVLLDDQPIDKSSPFSFHPGSNSSTAANHTLYPSQVHDDVHKKLETSLWSQHPEIHSVVTFVAEHVATAFRRRLKERVAEVVHRSWSYCDVVSNEALSSCRLLGSESIVEIDAAVSRYQAMIEKQTSYLLKGANSDIQESVIHDVGEHMEKTLKTFLDVYPISRGVRNTAISVALKQKVSISESLQDFFNVYARKKINEVCIKSVHRYRKTISDHNYSCEVDPTTDKRDTIAAPRQHTNFTVRALIGDRVNIIDNLRSCLYNGFHGVSISQKELFNVKCFFGEDRTDETLNSVDFSDTDEVKFFSLFSSCPMDIEFDCHDREAFLQDRSSFCSRIQYFSAYICGMLGKISTLCGQLVLLQFISSKEQAIGGSEINNCDYNRQTVNSSEFSALIGNNTRILCRAVSWLSDQRWLLSKHFECFGRMKIDFMKLFTQIIPPILTYNVVLAGLELNSNDDASIVLLDAARHGIINADDVSMLLGYAMKHSVFTAVFSLMGMKTDYARAALHFVGCYLKTAYPKKVEDFDIDVDFGLWATDPAVLRLVKSNISVDLASTIDSLSLKCM